MRRFLAVSTLLVVALAPPGPAMAARGTVPNRTYAAETLHQLISPPLGSGPHNQPAIVDGYLLLAGNARHSLWDISDPFHPRQVSAFDSPHHDGEAESHQVTFARTADGRMLLATTSGRGVDLWDLTEAETPALLAAVELEGVDYGDNTEAVWGLSWQGDTLWVGGTSTGLHVVDTRDPARPVVTGRLPTSVFGGVSAGPLWAIGDLLVITTPKESAGVATLDISDPAAPALVDFRAEAADSYIGGFYGRHVHLLTPFRTYDVTTDPGRIVPIASVDTVKSEYVSFGDGRLFLGRLRPDGGVLEIDLADPADLRIVASIDGRRDDLFGGLLTDDQFSLPVGNLLVLSDDEIGIGSVLAVRDTARDTRPPEVAWIHPADGAAGVTPTSRVGISFTDQLELASIDAASFVVRPVGGEPLAGSWGLNHTVVTFWPAAPLTPDTDYEVVLPAGGVADVAGNPVTATFQSTFTTGTARTRPACAIAPRDPAPVGVPVAFGLTAAAATSLPPSATLTWTFGHGDAEPAGSDASAPTATVSHAWAAPGRHAVTVLVETPTGRATCAGLQVVHRPLAPHAPAAASSLVLDEDRGRAWAVNPDADTVTAVDMASLAVAFEVPVGSRPGTVALSPDGEEAWITARDAWSLTVLDASDGSPREPVALPYASAPHGVAFSPDGAGAWVTLEATGQLARVDAATGCLDLVDLAPGAAVAPKVRGLAISPSSDRVWVARFVSPADRAEVYEVDVATLEVTRTLTLAADPGPDDDQGGRGIPNYLASLAVTPDGARAWVPSKKDNTLRGPTRDGEPMTTDNTVRTIVSVLDLDVGRERLDLRVDLDNHDLATAAAFSRHGDLAFVVSQGSNQVDVLDAETGAVVTGFATGLAPQAVAVDAQGRLWVRAELSRRLDVFDVSAVLDGVDLARRLIASVPTVAVEPLAPEVLQGKRIFHDASNRQMSRDGYNACATCHLDGGQDGRVWDFTGRGEGLRNTISMQGRAGTGHGPVHWTGNFDEVQDFEHDIRAHFGGSGFLVDADFLADGRDHPLGAAKAGYSDPLDALAAYVTTLDTFPRSPHRGPDGEMTAAARRGEAIFADLDCGDCHTRPSFTDSALDVHHDVGTATPASGQRLGGPLPGFDTPTLIGVWSTAPYFHDGSAATLRETLERPGHGNAADLSARDLDALVAFLEQLEGPATAASGADRAVAALCDPPGAVEPGGCACRAADSGPSELPIPLLAALTLLGLRARRRQVAPAR